MTVKELKEILSNENDSTEVTMYIDDGDNFLWKNLKSSWHTVDGKLVLSE